MLVRPLPGVDRNDLLGELTRLQHLVGNARTVVGTEAYDQYHSWVDDAVRSLSARISSDDVDRLVLTRRYWVLQSVERYLFRFRACSNPK